MPLARPMHRDSVMNNPNPDNDRNTVLRALAAQVNDLTVRLASALRADPETQDTLAKARQTPVALVHPLEQAILDLLAPGVAMTVTALATKLGTGRPGVHYHVKRLILSDTCRVIRAHRNRHVVDSVTLTALAP